MVDIKWKVNKCCHQNHFCIPVNIISLPDALNFYISSVNTLEFSHEQKLENIQKKIDELNKMKYILQNAKENKQSESYPRVFSENIDYLKRERGKKNR